MTAVRCSQAKRWCFTLNNYSEDEYHSIRANLESKANFAVIGKEVGESGTPHLQGYCSLQSKIRLTGLKKILCSRVHAEVARGTDKQNLIYCSKTDKSAWIFGSPREGTSEHGGGATDAASALLCVRKRVAGTSVSEILDDVDLFPAYLRHKRTIDSLVEAARHDQAIASARCGMGRANLFRWQCDLLNECLGHPSPRSVIWYTDGVGNSGKTWMSRYLMALHGALRLENGRSADLKHAYTGQRIVIFDFSRTQQEHINYETIESIKNGMVFSSKYDSCSKVFDIPHVIVFANWDPNMEAMSSDRWDLRYPDRAPGYCDCHPPVVIDFIESESQLCQASADLVPETVPETVSSDGTIDDVMTIGAYPWTGHDDLIDFLIDGDTLNTT